MSESLRSVFRQKYKEKILKVTHDPYQEMIAGAKEYDLLTTNLLEVKLDRFIFKYMKCINGFIGHDYLLLKSTAFDLLYYIFLKNEQLTNDQKEVRKTDLPIAFCLFINCIYSLKEKYLYFIGSKIDDKRLVFEKSILSSTGEKQIEEVFSKAYSEIGKYCDARNILIHSEYEILLNKNDQIEIQTTCSILEMRLKKLRA